MLRRTRKLRDTGRVTKVQEDTETSGRFGAGLTYDVGFTLRDEVFRLPRSFTNLKFQQRPEMGDHLKNYPGKKC